MLQLKRWLLLPVMVALAGSAMAFSQETKPIPVQANLNDLKSDLVVPETTDDSPGAGKRVHQSNPGYEGWKLQHVLYLPPDWKVGGKYPVIVEFPGNGNYKNQLGDISTGRVEDCHLGYGLSGGQRFIWVCLPFVDTKQRQHALNWWGDPDATAAYCRQTVQRICSEYGGDPQSVVLTGFSRGAIACSYIGLRDDETARLWRAMIVHSHYDGVRRWGYAGDDPTSAKQRIRRFHGKPQFVTHELSIDATRNFLQSSDLRVTYLAIPFPNHSPDWILKDLPERKQVRTWLENVISQQ